MAVLAVLVGLGWLASRWVRHRHDPPAAGPARSGRRPLTWVILAFNVLMLVWLISGVSATNCGAQEYTDACNAGAAIGAGLIVVLWALGDVILAVLWLVTRKPQRTCPVCGSPVPVGVTTCASCGHDFRRSVVSGEA